MFVVVKVGALELRVPHVKLPPPSYTNSIPVPLVSAT